MHATLDIDQARYNMIEQQIRPWDVLDQDVLDLLEVVRREDFVPPAHRLLAFTDMEIPLGKHAGLAAGNSAGNHAGHGARMWTPKMEARVVQELQARSHDRALEIGTGSGYLAALLAHRCHSVLSVEIDSGFKAMAERKLKAAGISNVRVQQGDGAGGFRSAGSEHFDVIVLTGSTPVTPQALLDQLNPGGRLFAVVGDAPAMTARLFTRAAHGTQDITAEDLFETVLAPLVNAAQPARFTF